MYSDITKLLKAPKRILRHINRVVKHNFVDRTDVTIIQHAFSVHVST